MVGPHAVLDPMLKRPFSLHRCLEDGAVEILYRVRGRGTRLLARLEPGDDIEVLGPLGRGFPLNAPGRPLLVGGGLGIVPLVELAARLADRSPKIFIGAANRDHLLSADLLGVVDPELSIRTDDGSTGRQGLVTEALEDYLDGGVDDVVVHACGPRPMLRALGAVLARRDITGYASLEEHMACGLGACMGCVATTTTGYRRVCREGPVFRLDEVFFDGGFP